MSDATIVPTTRPTPLPSARRQTTRPGQLAWLGALAVGLVAPFYLDAFWLQVGVFAGYRRVRLSTFGRVRSAGFAVLATFDRPHFTLVLADLSELTLTRLDRCFDTSIPNPSRSPGG